MAEAIPAEKARGVGRPDYSVRIQGRREDGVWDDIPLSKTGSDWLISPK